MINYETPLTPDETGLVTTMSHAMTLGTLSALADYSNNPAANPLAFSVSLMLDIDEYGNWDDLTIGEYIGLIARCKEGMYCSGRYYEEHDDDMPYMYAVHTLALALVEAAKGSALVRLFCNVDFEMYYECITSQKCMVSIRGFDHSPKLYVVVKGYDVFVRSGYSFWKDEDNYYRNMSDRMIANVYMFLIEPVVRSDSKKMKAYLKPDTAIGVVLSQKGDDEFGKE